MKRGFSIIFNPKDIEIIKNDISSIKSTLDIIKKELSKPARILGTTGSIWQHLLSILATALASVSLLLLALYTLLKYYPLPEVKGSPDTPVVTQNGLWLWVPLLILISSLFIVYYVSDPMSDTQNSRERGESILPYLPEELRDQFSKDLQSLNKLNSELEKLPSVPKGVPKVSTGSSVEGPSEDS